MLQATQLTKIYRTEEVETTALDHIDMRIEEGEFLSIMGPSGCGKSTLLNILGLLDVPTSGEYRFLDQTVSNYSEKALHRLRKGAVGFVFQNFNLIDELTVFENVELPLRYLRMPASERRRRVEGLLSELEILPRSNHFPAQLSGGQQQRVALARAVVMEPRLVVADEPTGNLDLGQGETVMRLLARLNEEGTTVVMVTHSLDCAEYGSRIVNLLDGALVETDGSAAG